MGMGAQAIAMALYGVRNCEDGPELRAVLATLGKSLDQCKEELNEQGFIMASMGLQCAGSSAEASTMRALLSRKGLPEGWSAHIHNGRVYYYHAEHGSLWTRPSSVGTEGAVAWTDHIAPCGRTYYHHPEHGSSWTPPPGIGTAVVRAGP